MRSRTAWLLKRARRQIWFGAAAISLFAVIVAATAGWLARHIPYEFTGDVGQDSVGTVLGIIASSMIFGLMRKHAELLASIRETSIALLGQQSALAAIKRALRVFDPTIARATEHQRRGDQVEGLYRFILDQLRQKARVTTLGAARELIEARRLDADNRTLLTALRKRIGDALHNMREQGCVYGEWYGAGGELE